MIGGEAAQPAGARARSSQSGTCFAVLSLCLEGDAMAHHNGTNPLDDDTGSGFSSGDVALVVLVAIIVCTGIGTLIWAIIHSLWLAFG